MMKYTISTALLLVGLAGWTDSVLGYNSYLGQLGQTPERIAVVEGSSPFSATQRPVSTSKIPFAVPENTDVLLGYAPRRHPDGRDTDDVRRPVLPLSAQQQRPLQYREQDYWANKYGPSIQPQSSMQGIHDIHLNGRQFERYRPGQGYNNYNGYNYRDNYGHNYNHYKGFNNVDFSGAKYYYDKATGRQYQNYEYNHNYSRNRNLNRYTTKNTNGTPKYYVDNSTGKLHANPEYCNGTAGRDFYYRGQTAHTLRHGSIAGVMGEY